MGQKRLVHMNQYDQIILRIEEETTQEEEQTLIVDL